MTKQETIQRGAEMREKKMIEVGAAMKKQHASKAAAPFHRAAEPKPAPKAKEEK